MGKSILFMMVGLPGSGKTTRAKELEAEYNALRLTPDEWILRLYGDNLDRQHRDAVRDPVEQLLWGVAKKVLSLGQNVIIDFGFWTYNERKKFRREAKTLGATVKIIFMDIPIDELWSRIASRPESQKGTLNITREELEQWAGLFEPPTQEELQ